MNTRLFMFLVFMIIASASWTNSKKVKRDVDMEAALCLYGCIYGNLNHSLFEDSGEDDGGSIICRHAKVEQLEDICRVFNSKQQCLDECPAGPLKTMVQKAIAYGCKNHLADFMKYTPCFTQHCTYIENACRPKCGSLKEAIHYTQEQKEKLTEIRKYSTNVQTGDGTLDEGIGLDFLQDINLAGGCEFFECYLNCSKEPLTQQCGEDTYKFLRSAAGELIPTAINGFYPNMTSPPEECQPIMAISKESTQAGSTLFIPSVWALVFITGFSLLIKH